jgi:hypothetical protein
MSEYIFTLTLSGITLTDPELNALYEAGLDDATFAVEQDGAVLAMFDRSGPSQEDAVLTAIRDVEKSDIGAHVLRVCADDDWLTASEIAERTGRSRASIRLLALGERGPGGFPEPAARKGSTNPLWRWNEVADWFEGFDPKAVAERAPKISPDFLAEVNDRLDLQERQRRVPDAPWRATLDEILSCS